MANNVVPFRRAPMQEGLRSFIVYNEMLDNCIPFEVEDRSMEPHVHKGDFVIVDQSDRDPMHGELFLIEWMNGNRQVVEVVSREILIHPRDGSPPRKAHCWFAEWHMSLMSLSGVEDAPTRWGDGPYQEEYFREKLIGRVVGIYEPDFRHELRRAA